MSAARMEHNEEEDDKIELNNMEIKIKETANILATKLGISTTIDDVNIKKFYEMIDELSNPPLNTQRILADLTHDIGKLLCRPINGLNVINYLKGENNNSESSDDIIINTFLTKPREESECGNAKQNEIKKWMDSTVLKNIDIEIFRYRNPDPDPENELINFKKAIERVNCTHIILDSLYGNPIRDYFKFNDSGIQWTFLYPTVCFTDGATKLTQNTVERDYNMKFVKEESEFKLFKFFDSREHIFNVDITNKKYKITSGIYKPESNSVKNILKVENNTGFSVNGICSAVGFPLARPLKEKSKKTKDEINVPKILNLSPTNKQKLEFLLIKTITDYSQVYYASFLYHILGFKTLFITNDAFCLRIAYLLKLPYVLFSSSNGNNCYTFDNKALELTSEDISIIETKVNQYKLVDISTKINKDIDDVFETIQTEYEKIFNNARTIAELLASDIILNNINNLKLQIEIRKKLLVSYEKTNISSYSLLLTLSINEFIFNAEREKHILEKEYMYLVELINNRIDTVKLSLNSSISEYIDFLLDKISNCLHLSEYRYILLFLLAITFNDSSLYIQYLVRYFFKDNNDTQIDQFRSIARYIFIYNTVSNMFEKTEYKNFIPLINLISNIYIDDISNINTSNTTLISTFDSAYRESQSDITYNSESYRGLEFYCYKYSPDKLNLSTIQSKLNEKFIKMIDDAKSAANEAAKKAFASRRTRAKSAIDDAATAEKKYRIKNIAVQLENLVKPTFTQFITTQNIDTLKSIREKIYKIQIESTGDDLGGITRSSKFNEKDYFNLMFIDYYISMKSVDPAAVSSSIHTDENSNKNVIDYFENSKILNIYNYFKFKDIEEPISDLKHFILLSNTPTVNLEPPTKRRRLSPSTINPIGDLSKSTVPVKGGQKRKWSDIEGQSGGDITKNSSVLKIIDYIDYNDFNFPEFPQYSKIYSNDDLNKLIETYKKYPEDISKLSISSNYLNEQLDELKIYKINNKYTVLGFYNYIFDILNILYNDAAESNEGDSYQYKLDILYLYFIHYDYNEKSTLSDLIQFMLNMILTDSVVEKYFKNLVSIDNITMILDKFVQAIEIAVSAPIEETNGESTEIKDVTGKTAALPKINNKLSKTSASRKPIWSAIKPVTRPVIPALQLPSAATGGSRKKNKTQKKRKQTIKKKNNITKKKGNKIAQYFYSKKLKRTIRKT